jgi:hypothetical protein
MAQHEVRGWTGRHHHQALVCLAQLFLLKQRVLLGAELPLLSARDRVELLAFYLPRAAPHGNGRQQPTPATSRRSLVYWTINSYSLFWEERAVRARWIFSRIALPSAFQT